MKKEHNISTLFLDIGGVLLTDGWDRVSRKNASALFKLDHDDVEERHHLTFETYEEGKITIYEYLERVVFYEKRNFTYGDFKEFMFSQSKPYNKMITLIAGLKKHQSLKIAVVSNEGRELNEHRIKKFGLNEFVDFFISSCIVHLRKPDPYIFKLAMDIAQVAGKHIVYIDDQPMFVQIAESLGINAIHHTDYNSTIEKLNSFGLSLTDDKA